MFSGQGSQYFQMGRELFENNSVFRRGMNELDNMARDIIGESIIDIIYNNGRKKNEDFGRTLYSHPAIFMVEYALAQALIESGIEPDYLLGVSLGNFTAAAIAGVTSAGETLGAVVKQAEAFEKNCPGGSMIVVLDTSSLYYETPQICDNSELAAVNFDSHFIISGDINKLNNIEIFLKENKILYQRLPVSYGFHSSYIEHAAPSCLEYLERIKYHKSRVPIVSVAHASIFDSIDKNYLWDVVRMPIEFQRTVKGMEDGGDYTYIDLGPSGTLSNFIKYNLTDDSKSESHTILTPFGQDIRNLEKVEKAVPKMKVMINKTEANTMLTVMFPGQGSQKKGMGESLFDEFKEYTEKADKVLGYSIKELCLEDPDDKLGQTRFTQPALYVVNALSYFRDIEQKGQRIDYAIGHSLGEYNALLAAGVYNFETGLKLVAKRGELMSKASDGGMAAVIGMSEEKIIEVLSDNNLNEIMIANLNTPSQVVISGEKDTIDKAKPIFESAGSRLYIPLNVSGAFHTSYMETAREEFEKFLDGITFSEFKIQVISNVTARPYRQEDIKKSLAEQITSPVRWTESVCYLMGKGEMEFGEIGPGTVLAGLVKKIKREAKPIYVRDEDISISENVKSSDESMLAIDAVKSRVFQEKDKKKTVKGVLDIPADSLGSDEYKKDYNLKYAYVAGGMYKGIASKEMVVKMGRAGMIGYLGTGAVALDEIEESIGYIQKELNCGEAYGMNLLNNPLEAMTVDLYLKCGVKNIEAAAYMNMTPSLVKYRGKGLRRESGNIITGNKIMAKVSRPEVAEQFFSPAPDRILNKLLEEGEITHEEAGLLKEVPMADDLCVEADSGGHTDQGVAYALMPAIINLRDQVQEKYGYKNKIRIGAAGGIGTPQAAAAAFILGADFILTGSINQCTVEAGTSDVVKDLLGQINVQDTDYAPAGDMFEMGARVQVLKKGVFFPARANKLYDLYQNFESLDEISDKTKDQLQKRYFKRTFDEIYKDCKEFYPSTEIERAEKNPKVKMAMIFKWYFGRSSDFALKGEEDRKVDFQVQCGPALGAFNQWVKGTDLENWKNRNVDQIALLLMKETAVLLEQRLGMYIK